MISIPGVRGCEELPRGEKHSLYGWRLGHAKLLWDLKLSTFSLMVFSVLIFDVLTEHRIKWVPSVPVSVTGWGHSLFSWRSG